MRHGFYDQVVGDLRWLLDKATRGGRLLASQVLIQGITAATSFLFIRGMSKAEYGWLTIATGLMSTVSILADLGTGAGFQAIAGRIWKEPGQLNRLVRASQQTRRWIAALVAVGASPGFAWLLVRNGAPLPTAATIVALGAATVWLGTGTAVLAVACRMHSRYEAVQRAEGAGALARLAIALSSVAVYLNAIFATTAALLGAVVHNWRTRRIAADVLGPLPSVQDDDYRTELMTFMKPLALPTLFVVMQGQVGLWVLGLLGATDRVADLGALSRFSVLLGIFATTAYQVAGPSFARCESPQELKRQVRRLFAGTLLAFGVAGSVLAAAPSWALALLGDDYAHLGLELRLVVLVALASTVSGLTWAINVGRGWVKGAWMLIPATILIQVLAIPFLNLSTVAGALLLALLYQVVTGTVYVVLARHGYQQWMTRSPA